ncbi:MAG: hypothetical protein QUS33_03555 [Dehalococcoidia bacterium]|nr:hypothetical protein [Dehalococcoidia bacterium]
MNKHLATRLLLVASSVIHPLLFAMFPVVYLYSHNVDEVSATQITTPLLCSVLGALALWVVLSLLLRSPLKAGVATTAFVILFFFYGRLYDLLLSWDIRIAKHAYLFPAGLLAWGYCVYFISRARSDLRITTRLLNVVCVVLICLNLGVIATHQVRKTPPAVAADGSAYAAADLGDLSAMPDIYYIILDEYAHPSTMLDYYEYDNSKFTDWLTNKGFFVALSSRTAYPLTNWSIASSLNMDYIPAGSSQEYCFAKMANNSVAAYLKSIGYRYVYSGVWFEQNEVGADLYYNFYRSSGGDTVVSQFSRTLWNTTMARPFYDHLTGAVYAGHTRSAIINQIECLKTMPNLDGPKFVFTHIICPHAPFVFGPNGEYVDPLESNNFEDKQFYLGQYRFISRQIEAVVDALLAGSEVKPIIILQSDHGLRCHGGSDVPVPEGEWQKILNAYYLPGGGEEALYDSISPVNTFRIVFNQYFGADYDLLPDVQPSQSAG